MVALGYHHLAVFIAGTYDDGCTVRPVLQYGDGVYAPSSGQFGHGCGIDLGRGDSACNQGCNSAKRSRAVG